MLRKYLLILSLLLASIVSQAQGVWTDMTGIPLPIRGERRIVPFEFYAFKADVPALQSALQSAPMRDLSAGFQSGALISLPTPEGGMAHFRVCEAPVFAPELQAKYPETRSYTGRGVEDPSALLKCDFTPWGFHAMVLSRRHDTWFIDPYFHGDTEYYVVYNKKDYQRKTEETFACLTEPEPGAAIIPSLHGADEVANTESVSDCLFRTYRLALACTGEYAQFHGGTVPLVLAAMATTMNRVNGVYENDFSVTMVMVPNNNQLVYLNGSNDPYTNGNGSTMLNENVGNCNAVIGSANYDIGHVFSTGGGGIAGLKVVCGSNKANGVTGSGAPIGDAFDIDYVAHEMGHQFGANHTQNNNCNRVIAASMEPGSASTIMGYAGICAPDVQAHSDDYFHAISMQEIGANISTSTGNNCPVKVNTGNSNPSVNGGADYTIPKSTPFALTAIGSDADGDSLSYCWEQMDPEFATMPPVSTSATGPLFRSYKGTESPTRTFPRIPDLLANINSTWEELPGVARTMKFRVTVRDNHPTGSCSSEDNVVVTVAGGSGPFLVTAPNTAVTWLVGAPETITWNVANTTAAPVNCANVQILLSLDGGYTYPVVLASNVPNNGSAAITVPNQVSNTCRVKVQSVGNIFFDISNQNFAITLPPTPTFLLSSNPTTAAVCAGENVHIELNLTSIAGYADTVGVVVSGAPAGAILSIAPDTLTPTGIVSIDITGLTSDMAGTYTLNIEANANGLSRQISFPLSVFPGAPSDMAQLISPANGANGFGPIANLEWQSVVHAQEYQVEVSSNPDFNAGALVYNQTVSDTNTAVGGLAIGAVYYWRVKPSNLCGEADFSIYHAFQVGTLDCANHQFTATDVPKAIDAASVNTVQSNLMVPDNAIVGDVNIQMAANHTWVGDLKAWLQAPSGDSIQLFDQPGVPASTYGCGEITCNLPSTTALY